MKNSFQKVYYSHLPVRLLRLAIIFIIIGSMVGVTGCKNRKENVPHNIHVLDSLLNHTEEFTLQQLTKIEELRQKRSKATTPIERHVYDYMLYESFYTLSSDSALYYADQSIKSAEEAGNNDWVIRSKINKASLLTATGLLQSAMMLMTEINPADLDYEQLVEYYGQMIYLYSHLGNFEGSSQNRYYVIERLYKDSIMNVIKPSHPEYLWYKSWDIIGTDQNPDTVILALQESLANSKLSERQDAKNAYVLARLYKQEGDRDKYLDYMALSAIIDVKIANAEIASLEDLAKDVFDDGKGDIDRSYRYIYYSFDKAMSYPNRTREFGIARTLDSINDVVVSRMRQQQHRTITFLVLVCVLALILLVAILAIIMQNKKLKVERHKTETANDELSRRMGELSAADTRLNEMNQLLKELNDDLQKKNEELYESNFVKEEYIGYVFNLCSSYIAQIEELKRNIYLKVVKKQYKDIEAETSNIDMKEDLKAFYHSFDSIFLNIYPNFVADFNSLLEPDKQITLKEGELLNMELRIYALVRLGITDSVKIADFLHCAPQTVYNYRLRARSRTIYPKSEFIEKVKSLDSFQANEKMKERKEKSKF